MRLLDRSKRLLVTLKYLKSRQLSYRLYYAVRKKFRNLIGFSYPYEKTSHTTSLHLQPTINPYTTFKDEYFIFLNQSHVFDKGIIDWNYPEYGKLWTYNLTYFDYLLQEDLGKEDGMKFIYQFIKNIPDISDGMMPFPISLRGMNWIKFITKYDIKDPKVDDSLYAQYDILLDTLEYHILGNHLLENGFSLLFGAYYFSDEKLYQKASEILISELHEQILHDGGHYELSPMYHQIMLYRILDCINLIQNNQWKKDNLCNLFIEKAEIMLSWLDKISYSDGSIPLFNDSANDMAPTTGELKKYASQLKIKPKQVVLGSSGYRKFETKNYEMIVDVGNIGPDYIPGHAHSDTFNFELKILGKLVIVDTGISTYESNERRQLERSTFSHNTVMINNTDQSNVWGGFRVAERAKIVSIKETDNTIKAVHNGYRKFKILHQREFIANKGSIRIKDIIDTKKKHRAEAYIHFHPEVNVEAYGHSIQSKLFTIKSSFPVILDVYEYAPSFNTKIKAQCAKITFENELKLDIILHN